MGYGDGDPTEQPSIGTKHGADAQGPPESIARGDKFTVTLPSLESGLGLKVVGPSNSGAAAAGDGVYISHVTPGGVSAASEKITEGLKIVKINGKSVTYCTKRDAVALIKAVPHGVDLTLTLRSDPKGFG